MIVRGYRPSQGRFLLTIMVGDVGEGGVPDGGTLVPRREPTVAPSDVMSTDRCITT
jgi:hypothetical protein